MTDGTASEDGSSLRLLTNGAQVGLGVLVVAGIFGIDRGGLLNLGVPFLLAVSPSILRYRYDYRVHPILGLVIVLAATLHVAGSLGLYRAFPWFDQLAHGVSGGLVAGVGYAVVQAIDREHDAIVVPDRLRIVFLFVFATAFGVFWEIAEFAATFLSGVLGGDPLLAQYGLSDVVLDMLFNAVGALVIAAVGTSYFDAITRLLRGVYKN